MNDHNFLTSISQLCSGNIGGLDKSFLCQSISAIMKGVPITVVSNDSLEKVIEIFKKAKVGCVGVVDKSGAIEGIFSERDYILKVANRKLNLADHQVSEFMTNSPIVQKPDCSMAYALTLMSTGGFRHMPIVDNDMLPIAILSVKDIIDFLVNGMTKSLMAFGK